MTSFRTKIAKKKEMTRKDLCVPFSECQSAVKIMFDIGTIFVVIRVNFPLKKRVFTFLLSFQINWRLTIAWPLHYSAHNVIKPLIVREL